MSDAERTARQALSLLLLLYGFWIMRTPDGYHFLDAVDRQLLLRAVTSSRA